MALLSTLEASTASPVTRRAWTRWEPLSGVAFVALFVGGFAAMSSLPDANASNQKWVDYFASSGNQISMVVSGFLLVLAGLSLLWFLTTIWSRVAAARRPEATSPLAVVAAGVAAGAIAIGGVLNAIIAGGMIFSKLPEPRADILRVFGELSFPVIAVAGMIALAVAVGTLSVQASRASVFSTALTVFSLIVAVVALFSFVFFPIVLVMIWSLVASVALLRAKPGAAKTASS